MLNASCVGAASVNLETLTEVLLGDTVHPAHLNQAVLQTHTRYHGSQLLCSFNHKDEDDSFSHQQTDGITLVLVLAKLLLDAWQS